MIDDSGKLLRFAGAAIAATFVVLVLMIVSLWAFGVFDRPAGHHAVDVRLISDRERIDLAEALGENQSKQRPSLPPLADIPAVTIPRRSESGFVQIEFSVDQDGRVTDAEVVRSMPEGVFEEQALEIVRSRVYEGDDMGRQTDIIDFVVEPEDD